MAAENTSQAQLVYPAAADSVSATSGGSTWSNGSWVQLTASTASAITLCGISMDRRGGSQDEIEVDIGSGGAGSEVVIGTLRMTNFRVDSGQEMYFPFTIPISNIATATRVAVRFRSYHNTSITWKFALVYYGSAAPSGITVTANKSQIAPAAANEPTVATSSTAWANSSWSQIVASTSSAIILAAIVWDSDNSVFNTASEIDIGTGGAGSESVVTTFRVWNPQPNKGFMPLVVPLDNIATSTRVAFRVRAGGGTFSANFGCSIIYYNKPL